MKVTKSIHLYVQSTENICNGNSYNLNVYHMAGIMENALFHFPKTLITKAISLRKELRTLVTQITRDGATVQNEF